jgi:S1-C subfamily serine protease
MLAERHGQITRMAATEGSAAGTGRQAASPARGPGTETFAISSVRRDLLVHLMRLHGGPVQRKLRWVEGQAVPLATWCCGSSLACTAKTDVGAQANQVQKTGVAEGPFGRGARHCLAHNAVEAVASQHPRQ